MKAAGVEDVRDGITITCCDLRKLDSTMTAAPVERTHANAIRLVPHVTQTNPNPNLEGEQFTLEPMADEASCCGQIKNACSRVKWCTERHILLLLFLIPSSMVTLTVLLLTYTDTSAFLASLPCTIVLCVPWGFGCVMYTVNGHGRGCAVGWFRMCTDGFELEYAIPWLGCTSWLSFVVFLITFPLALDGSIPNNTSGDWAIAFTPMWIWAFMITVLFPCNVRVSVLGITEQHKETGFGRPRRLLLGWNHWYVHHASSRVVYETQR